MEDTGNRKKSYEGSAGAVSGHRPGGGICRDGRRGHGTVWTAISGSGKNGTEKNAGKSGFRPESMGKPA